MKRLCHCGCRRPAVGEWLHATLGVFEFAALCNLRFKPTLELSGWDYFPPLDNRADEVPEVTLTGGTMDADCG